MTEPKRLYTRGNKFVDRLVMRVRSGNGGNGALSFQTNRRTRVVPPDGGDGGRGGDVVLLVSSGVDDFRTLRRFVRAPDGGSGRAALCSGKNGATHFIAVPVGTRAQVTVFAPPQRKAATLFDEEEETKGGSLAEHSDSDDGSDDGDVSDASDNDTDSASDTDMDSGASREPRGEDEDWMDNADPPVVKEFTVELNKPGGQIVVCRGGRGGRGNASFLTSTNRSPQRTELGGCGQEAQIVLEMLTIADVGLVGFPNAGKTSFLNAATRARQKVGAYPFTTLTPFVGVVQFSDESRFTIADIPGILEGAHEDRGLGLSFLRHIHRTRVLAYVVDLVKSHDEWLEPVAALHALRSELHEYASSVCGCSHGVPQKQGCVMGGCLVTRPALVIATKIDEKGAAARLKHLQANTTLPVRAVSSTRDRNVDDTLVDLLMLVEWLREQAPVERV